MNVEIWAEATLFPEKEYINGIAVAVRIHERTISLRFLGIILRVLWPEVSAYDVCITDQFQITFAQGVVEVTANSKEENSIPITSKNSV
jgi:hypothetical protein